MTTIAIVEDDKPVGDLFIDWLKKYDSNLSIDHMLTERTAEIALRNKKYDLVLMDLELAGDEDAGVRLIKQLLLTQQECPVVVVTGLDADKYRSIMKVLAWDYLQKPADRATLVSMVKSALNNAPERTSIPDSFPTELVLDPLHKTHPTWRGKRLIIPMTAQRILFRLASQPGRPVANTELMKDLPYNGSERAIRTHINTIRSAFKDVDPDFDSVKTVPLVGYLWHT
jgi:two-component system, OmpR family, response regulator ChvI